VSSKVAASLALEVGNLLRYATSSGMYTSKGVSKLHEFTGDMRALYLLRPNLEAAAIIWMQILSSSQWMLRPKGNQG
jgi:hypothetical protein